jgi:DNA-binding CsgD family transcriptional regulator/tetratricopeptide (TPR) repeat protein
LHDLPGPLRLSSRFPFVGRAAELEAIRTLNPTDGEGPRVVLLGGAPGAGKSRLVRVYAREFAEQGGRVLYGACDAVVRTPYGPFVEALDQLTRAINPDELRAALGGSGELTRLLPDLAARVGDLPSPRGADPDTERHRLHTAVADLLTDVSRERPVLLVLEDGHWADGATLLLLRHLARGTTRAGLRLLATFRDTDADVPAALSETLADLRRSDDVVRLRLAGLSDDDVSDFVRHAAEGDLDAGVPELARAITDLTGGNPFLVCELWRALAETDGVEVVAGTIRLTRSPEELGTPESVSEVVSQRLARLDPGTSDLLELAAIAGSEFDLATVRRASGLGEPELPSALDQAVRSGMIEEVPSRRLVYRFTHELVRRALYDRLSGTRRAELHLRVGEALEAEAGRPGQLADLAHHFGAAAPFGDPERAVDYNLRAARAATAALAFDEAAALLRTALDLQADSSATRAEIFIELGLAHHRSGKALDALAAFGEAAEIARQLDDPRLLARAAIGYEDACWRPGLADQDATELLEEATAALGPERSELRVRLLGGLARALDFLGDHPRAAAVRTSAIAMARELGDQAGLATVLMRSYWSRSTSTLEILAMLSEARDLGEQLGNTEIRAEAMAWRVPAFVVLCDLASARREVETLRETAEQTAQPFMLHVADHYASALALGDGRLEEAEAFAQRSHEWSRLLTGRDASGVYGIQMFSIRREQGRLAEVAPAMRLLAGSGDADQGPWRPGLVALLVELGMHAEARRELSGLLADGIDAFRESLWLASLTYLADACAALGDDSVAALVYPELEPLAGASVMIGHLVSFYGAADRYLGMLAATLGMPDRAQLHFEAAMELNRRMGADTWLAHTAYEYARLLLEPERGGEDRQRASAMLAEAATLSERIGLRALSARVAELASPATAELPDELSPREAQILRLVSRGLSNREIGEALVISEHTVANHMRSILRKTDCANRTEAASYAHRHRLADP